MKRRYQLLLIIIFGTVSAIYLSTVHVTSKINYVAIGDSLAIGTTSSHVIGQSFNDYYKESLDAKKKLGEYNIDFSQSYLNIHTLNEYLNLNKIGCKSEKPIKQIIENASILTIAIGEDEFIDLATKENLQTSLEDKYLKEMKKLLQSIREFYSGPITIIGLYPWQNFKTDDVYKINNNLKKLCISFKASFIDLLSYSEYTDPENYFLNYIGHQKIASELMAIYN